MNIDVFYVAIIVNWTSSVGAFLNFVFFPKISGLYQKHRLPWNQLEKLGEVFKNNFLTAMQDLKRRIKAGTAKNRCHTISERSLIHNLFNIISVAEYRFNGSKQSLSY